MQSPANTKPPALSQRRRARLRAVGDEKACHAFLENHGARLSKSAARASGAWSIGYASDMTGFAARRQLTAFMLDWSGVYRRAAEAVAAGAWRPEERLDGLAAGVISMARYNSALSSTAQEKLRETEAGIGSGALHPFAGVLWDRDGNLRAASGAVLTAPEIRAMDWFVSGIVTGGV